MKGMKHSIRIRFTLIFIGLMAVALAGLFMINRFFLERFYQSEKVKELEQAYTQVDALLVFAKENGGVRGGMHRGKKRRWFGWCGN